MRIADTERAAEVANAIDALFTNSLNPTRTITEAEQARQFMQQIGDIGLMMTGILAAVFFTILLLTGNTMAQALRERVPELAVLKTIGFSDGAVAALVLGEALLLCLVGGAFGHRSGVGRRRRHWTGHRRGHRCVRGQRCHCSQRPRRVRAAGVGGGHCFLP